MQHPVQALATVGTLVITATNSTLNCFDLSTNTQTGTSTSHSALIRSLATFTDKTSSISYIVSTGEDKQLVVSSLPTLEQVSKRELLKRANALDVTDEGEIIIGDKFGDVYLFPLHPPAATQDALATTPSDAKSNEKEKKAVLPEHLPILGHVSMLNTLALIPALPSTNGKQYIATGDRDEHVRISRFPMGHVIEGFLWGSKNFVSSLLYLPPLSDSSPPMLLSAGGDPTIQVHSLTLPSTPPTSSTPTASPVGDLITQFPIESLLLEHVVVAPVLPDPVPAGRKKDKKGKGKSTNPSTAEGTPEVEVQEEVNQEEVEEEKKELKLGLAVIKMVEVGASREQGGIVVLAAGSTALLYIPFSSLLPSSTTLVQPPSLVNLPHPILDFIPLPIPSSSTSSLEFLITLDTTRPTPSTTATSSFARVSLTSHVLSLLPQESTSLFNPSSKAITTQIQPSISSLYPVLMMLHHPGDDSELVDSSASAGAGTTTTNPHNPPVETSAGNGKPKGGLRNLKRPATELGEAAGGAGKRAVGRAETLRRWEEAKRKLEEKKELTEGEKEAVEIVEKEKMQEDSRE